MKTIAGWYRKAGKHSEKIPSIIVNQCIDKLLEHVQEYLSNYLIHIIKVETKIHSDSVEVKVIEINFDIKPYVEYVKKINQVESDKVRVTFSISLGGKVEDIRLRSNFRNRQIDVFIDRIIAYLTVSIIKITASILYVPTISLSRPIVLSDNQLFKVENLFFQLPM
jgi:hypothetical protein